MSVPAAGESPAAPEVDAAAAPGSAWPLCIFAVVVALYVVPFWVAPYAPTDDGGSHLYNAWVLGQLASPAPAPLLRACFEVNRQPLPNWLTHVVLAALLRVAAPPVAEKILLSSYVLLLAAGLWYLAGAVDRRRSWLALLGLPLVWTTLLQMGFYNFCYSLGFFLFALGLWWRRRTAPGWRLAVELNLLLALCYFAHIVSALLALGGIAVLWLASGRAERRRGHWLHLAIVAPAAILPLWFLVSRRDAPPVPSQAPAAALWSDLARLAPLDVFTAEGGATGRILAALFAAWVVFTLWRRREPVWREEDGFLVLAALLAGVYFAGPEGAAGGQLLKPRLLLYPFLAVLPWLSCRLGRWGTPAAVAGLALLAARPALYAVDGYRAASRQVAAFTAAFDAVPAGSVVVPLLFDRRPPAGLRVPVLAHAAGYAAIAKGLVDWDDYEAATDLFPLRYRADAGHQDREPIESDPAHVSLRRLETHVDSLVCWHLPAASPMAARLAARYRLLAAGDEFRVYATARSGGPRP